MSTTNTTAASKAVDGRSATDSAAMTEAHTRIGMMPFLLYLCSFCVLNAWQKEREGLENVVGKTGYMHDGRTEVSNGKDVHIGGRIETERCMLQ